MQVTKSNEPGLAAANSSAAIALYSLRQVDSQHARTAARHRFAQYPSAATDVEYARVAQARRKFDVSQTQRIEFMQGF
jgi:hypothetical protein